MTGAKSLVSKAVNLLDPQQGNREWWESNPMTYDWEKTLQINPGTSDAFVRGVRKIHPRMGGNPDAEADCARHAT